MKRILVTGGTGFLAQNIILYLESKGYDVWYLTRKFSNNIKAIVVDITEKLDLEQRIKLKHIDAIIHVAAYIPEPENKQELDLCQKVNFDGTNLLLKYSCENNIKKFIYISSLSIFDENKETIIDENTVPNPKSEYSISKLSAEYLCRFYHRNYGIVTPILRLGTIYGTGMNKNRMIPFFIQKCLLNETFDVYRSNIQLNIAYIKDVVNVIEKTLNAESTLYHFATESLTKKEMVQRIALITGSNSKINFTQESYNEIKKFSLQKIKSVLKENDALFYTFENGIKDYLNFCIL